MLYILVIGVEPVSTYWKLASILLIAVLTAGCSAGEITETLEPTDAPAPSAEPVDAYPYPMDQPTVPVGISSYPGPDNTSAGTAPALDLVPVLDVPSPASGLGVVTGFLLVGGEGGQPYFGNAVYLGHALAPSDPAFPPMISLSESEDPLAVMDQTGRFLFVDVEPGTYGLVLWSPVGSAPMQDPATGAYMIIEVKADQVIDLGVIPIK